MKTMILAGVAVLGLGVGSAYADANSTGGQTPNTFFTLLPGVIAKTPVQNVAPTQDGRAIRHVPDLRGGDRNALPVLHDARPPTPT